MFVRMMLGTATRGRTACVSLSSLSLSIKTIQLTVCLHSSDLALFKQCYSLAAAACHAADRSGAGTSIMIGASVGEKVPPIVVAFTTSVLPITFAPWCSCCDQAENKAFSTAW